MRKQIGKKILIAMTGRRDSTVAAYLLKKQGYECIGITFLLSDEKKLQEQIDHVNTKINSSESDDSKPEELSNNKQISKAKLYSRCHVQNIDDVAEICHKLDITFYGVKAETRFTAGVIDKLVGSKLGGKTFQTCVQCNNVKLILLAEKAKELGCDYIATGHYAKVVVNQKTGHHFIHAANDLAHDQSYLLSRVPQEALSKLVLPLSEMRLEEVEKVMKMIDFDLLLSSGSDNCCFIGDAHLPSLIEVCSAPSLLRPGHILLQNENIAHSEHSGIHNFDIGQSKLKLGSEVKTNSNLIISELVPTTGDVVILPEHDVFFDRLKIQNVEMDPTMDISKPFIGFIKMGTNHQLEICHVYYKNFHKVIIVFPNIRNGKVPGGTSVAIYNKMGISAKIILSGEVIQSGVLHNGEFVSYIKQVNDDDSEEEAVINSQNPLPDNFH